MTEHPIPDIKDWLYEKFLEAEDVYKKVIDGHLAKIRVGKVDDLQSRVESLLYTDETTKKLLSYHSNVMENHEVKDYVLEEMKRLEGNVLIGKLLG